MLPIWKQRRSAETKVTTPNSDVLYAMSYLDLGKDGPLVMEAPQGLQGILLDAWQRPIPGPIIRGQNYLGDVGFFGPDSGNGGKFLIVPPGYQGDVPDDHFVYRSATNFVFVFLRGFYSDPANLEPATKLMEQTKIYPLGNKAGALPMKYPNGSKADVDMLPPTGFEAFVALKGLIDAETYQFADPDWMGMLKAIGIEKGKPFNRDQRTQRILDRAGKAGYNMSRALGPGTAQEVDGLSYLVYSDKKRCNPMAAGNPFDLQWRDSRTGITLLNSRTNFFTNYYSWSPGMVSQVPGKGRQLHGRKPGQ